MVKIARWRCRLVEVARNQGKRFTKLGFFSWVSHGFSHIQVEDLADFDEALSAGRC